MPAILPRFIRLRDAPFYLGMDRNRFNREVRPYIDEIRIGSQGVAFDRLDLDAWADERKLQVAKPRGRGTREPSRSGLGEFQQSVKSAERKRTR